jgi:hypothetical protein
MAGAPVDWYRQPFESLTREVATLQGLKDFLRSHPTSGCGNRKQGERVGGGF